MSEELEKVMPGWHTEGVLGSGAFGTVYLARQDDKDGDGAFCALKVIRVPPQREAVDNAVKLGIGLDLLSTYFGKFKNDLTWELTMYKTVKSVHLAPVEEFAAVDYDGPGWTGYIRTGIYTPIGVYYEKTPPTPEDAARMGLELSSALETLEHYAMIHGEIKPENVMVTDAGSFVLTDLGLRRCLEKAGSGIFGTEEDGFEAPELGQDRTCTAQTDIYSLGALMCWAANGGSMPPNRDPGLIRDIDPALEAVIRKAMAADPAQRYTSASQLRQELERTGLGKKPARRAMAAAAAFDAVKRNGGAVKARPAAQERPAPRAAAPDKPAAPRGEEEMPAADTVTQKPRRSVAGIAIGVIAALLIIAVVAAIWLPGRNGDPGKEDDGPNHGIIYPNPNEEDQNPNDDDQNPNDGEQTPGEDQNPNDGEQNPGDDQNPNDGEQNPGEDQNPNDGEQNPGEDQNPGGEQTPGEEQNPGGEQNPGEEQNPGGQDDEPDTPTRPEAVNNDILFPSDTKLITRDDLEGKTRSQVSMLINEIYARHGYIFGKGGETQTYFNSQKWYTPVTDDASKVTPLFNATENANIKTLTDYQREKGWRGGGTTSKPSEPEENTYIFPSDTTLVTRADLEGKTQREVTLMLNEIFARHGYIFSTDYLKEYFESQAWYKPVTNSASVVTKAFNDIEQANSSFINKYMHEMGWR